MKIFVATHDEGGLICAGRSIEEVARRVVEAFEYDSWVEEDGGIRFTMNTKRYPGITIGGGTYFFKVEELEVDDD